MAQKLRERVSDVVRRKGYSRETFKTYWNYCEQFIRWARLPSGEWRHPESLGRGMDIRSLQSILGHADIRTTMIYTHVEQAGVTSETSPLDRLPRIA